MVRILTRVGAVFVLAGTSAACSVDQYHRDSLRYDGAVRGQEIYEVNPQWLPDDKKRTSLDAGKEMAAQHIAFYAKYRNVLAGSGEGFKELAEEIEAAISKAERSIQAISVLVTELESASDDAVDGMDKAKQIVEARKGALAALKADADRTSAEKLLREAEAAVATADAKAKGAATRLKAAKILLGATKPMVDEARTRLASNKKAYEDAHTAQSDAGVTAAKNRLVAFADNALTLPGAVDQAIAASKLVKDDQAPQQASARRGVVAYARIIDDPLKAGAGTARNPAGQTYVGGGSVRGAGSEVSVILPDALMNAATTKTITYKDDGVTKAKEVTEMSPDYLRAVSSVASVAQLRDLATEPSFPDMIPLERKVSLGCLPPPDQAAFQTEAALKAILPENNGEVSAEFKTAVTKLFEESERTLFLQYAMYRLCEMSINAPSGFRNVYPVVVHDIVRRTAEMQEVANAESAKARIAEATADAQKAQAKVQGEIDARKSLMDCVGSRVKLVTTPATADFDNAVKACKTDLALK